MIKRANRWALVISRDVHAVYLASRDPRVPWYTKALAIAVAGYALSPIDLIPDFIPILGLLDDLIIVPLGILLAVRLIPPDIMAEHRASALAAHARPVSRIGAAAIVAVWLVMLGLSAWLAYGYIVT
ncbi:MAG TPA: YkvA family protein [Xanthobacteraceae bacterium]|jgi:uncharacterized membrane protein YkvA (DUF1232 family)|nr:YkvA family protein [Xanthobacteraceae bacterium]